MPRSKRRRTTSKRWRTFLFPFEGVFYTRVSFYTVSSYSDCCPYTHIQKQNEKKKRNTEKKRREILHSAALAVVFRLKPKRIETSNKNKTHNKKKQQTKSNKRQEKTHGRTYKTLATKVTLVANQVLYLVFVLVLSQVDSLIDQSCRCWWQLFG